MGYIELHGVEKIYNKGKGNEVKALRGLDLVGKRGESVAVMGVSGSGKSTLLHVIGTLDDYEAGSYILDGCEVKTLNAAQKARLRNEKIGFALQDFGLLESESVAYNIRLPLYFGKVKGSAFAKKTEDAAKRMGIADLLKRKVSQLSGGQKQRVALARAIVTDPELILADEPTSALDRATSDDIIGEFLKLNAEGKTVVMVTHDGHVAERFGRTVYIEDGSIKEK